ncbi:MAG: helix-turn-helix domain-containing protein [Gammaproteobacteria bacterium]|jgi:Cu(I)-responsive transcriptional regulator
MRIGGLAARSGTLVETIRYYERIGLMPTPPRSPSGYRQYRPEHLQRLLFLRRCRALGFSIEEIRSLIALASGPDRSCRTVRSIAERHLEDVRQKLADLRRLELALGALVESCAGGPIAECKILEALAQGAERSTDFG